MSNFRINPLKRRIALFFSLSLVVALVLSGCATQNGGRGADGSVARESDLATITSISLSDDADAVSVVITGNKALTYTSVKQPLPLGIVLYFPDTAIDTTSKFVPSSILPVTSVNASQIDGLVSGLTGGAAYEVMSNTSNLARVQWDAFNIILIVAVCAILIGGLISIGSMLIARQKEDKGESA